MFTYTVVPFINIPLHSADATVGLLMFNRNPGVQCSLGRKDFPDGPPIPDFYSLGWWQQVQSEA